jgi:hypothetical protein
VNLHLSRKAEGTSHDAKAEGTSHDAKNTQQSHMSDEPSSNGSDSHGELSSFYNIYSALY